ncbi:MAG TPA: peptidoglycan editing factor PgeF [Usitatibacter sp.]|nr:peptidoglycan editing factor PgeF [Usitatibacter sp.]
MKDWLVPDWPAPRGVRAFVTTRSGGVSTGEFASMNLGLSSGDEAAKVERNRAIVRAELPSDPVYLVQVHGTGVTDLDRLPAGERPRADAAVTAQRGRVATVLVADCMPLLLCDRGGTRVVAAHAGWRGMAAGVIENAVASLQVPPAEVIAWMGPAIGPDAFEVGPEVREAFLAVDSDAQGAFRAHAPGKYMADLYTLARRRLARIGVGSVHGGGFCTFHEPGRFFSYRRVKASGRMGAFVWMV